MKKIDRKKMIMRKMIVKKQKTKLHDQNMTSILKHTIRYYLLEYIVDE